MTVIDQEKKIIRMSMVVLSMALIVIYVLLYYVKGKNLIEGLDHEEKINDITKIENNSNSGTEIKILTKSGDNKINIIPEKLTGNQNSGINKSTGNITNITLNTGGYGFLNNTTTSNIKLLSGTYIYYKTLDSVEKLGVKYKYILTDEKDIYYVFLGTGNNTYDFSDIVRKLGGSLYEIKTEQEIIQNKLFGDKITYINLTEYKNKFVLMLIEYNKENWIIQIDYDIYYKSKPYIKSLFQ